MEKKRNMMLGIVGVLVLVVIGIVAVFTLGNKGELSGEWHNEGNYLTLESSSLTNKDLIKEEVSSKDLESLEYVKPENPETTKIKQSSKNITLDTKDETDTYYHSTYTYQQKKEAYLFEWESSKTVFQKDVKISKGTKSYSSASQYYEEEDGASYDSYYQKENGEVVFNPELMSLKGTTLTKEKLGKMEVSGGKMLLAEDKKTLYIISSMGKDVPYYFITKYSKQ